MVSGGEEIPHKRATTKGRQPGYNDLYYNKEEGNFYACQNGQHGIPALWKWRAKETRN